MSKKGWIDTELFYHWLKNHFLKYAVPARPLLLIILDGHSSHFQPEVLQYAKTSEVLTPHTTHATQPLDAVVFVPLKQHWANVCHKYMQKNPGKRDNQISVLSPFQRSLDGDNKAFKCMC